MTKAKSAKEKDKPATDVAKESGDTDKTDKAKMEMENTNPVVQLSQPGCYKCNFQCRYSTNRSSDRPRHETTCDLNPEKQFGCSECHFFINGKLNYEQHVAVAHTHQPVTCKAKGKG